MVAGDRAEPLQGHGDGDAGLVDELAQLLGRAGGDHAAAAIDDRPSARPDRRERPRGPSRPRAAAAAGSRAGPSRRRNPGSATSVFWMSLGTSIRTGPGRPVRGDVERLLDDPGDVAGVLHQVMMLGDRPADLDHRRFLEGVGADDVGGDLAGDGDDRQRVHLGVGQAGHQVQGARGRRSPSRRRACR